VEDFLFIGLGVVLLYSGGEVLVGSVSRMATAFGVSPLVIGLTVVAFGTSSPEIAVAVGAALSGQPDIALGNVLGSNVANLGLILGLSAVIAPVEAHSSFLRRDLPFMLGVAVLLLVAGWIGFDRRLGVVLVTLLAAYLWVLFRAGGAADLEDAEEGSAADRWVGTAGAVLGIGLLVFGADVLVDSAVEVARGLGVSERIIGLTLVAFGTSLPELSGCLVAAAHNKGDLIIGNIAGSNIFNTLLVLPAAIFLLPIVADASDLFDVGVVIGFSTVACVLFFRNGRLSRRGGALLLSAYVVYVVYLFTVG